MIYFFLNNSWILCARGLVKKKQTNASSYVPTRKTWNKEFLFYKMVKGLLAAGGRKQPTRTSCSPKTFQRLFLKENSFFLSDSFPCKSIRMLVNQPAVPWSGFNVFALPLKTFYQQARVAGEPWNRLSMHPCPIIPDLWQTAKEETHASCSNFPPRETFGLISWGGAWGGNNFAPVPLLNLN